MQNSQLGKLQILVVDDEKTIVRLITDVLIQLGFKDVVIATSGRKAIELLSKQKFDFIITDWRMGDLDGIDLVRFVRTSPESTHPTVPIIMLTGNAEAHYVMTARNAGINSYLIKPFSASQLVRRLRQTIEQPREFVIAPSFRGPDRRHRDETMPDDLERRKPRMKRAS
jgi:CheY-like chemotaxis protein